MGMKWSWEPGAQYVCGRPACTYVARHWLHIAAHQARCPKSHDDLRRLLDVVVDENDCWRPSTSKDRAKVRGGVRAHIVSLEMKLGRKLGPNMKACHVCDVSACVNPDHIWEGTQADNIHDMIAKGRNRNQYTGRLS